MTPETALPEEFDTLTRIFDVLFLYVLDKRTGVTSPKCLVVNI